MKKPELKDLNSSAVPSAPLPVKDTAIRKTFSFNQSHLQHINAVAAELSLEQGKPVNASVALRFIIDEHRGKGE